MNRYFKNISILITILLFNLFSVDLYSTDPLTTGIIGSSSSDVAYAVVADNSGNIFVVGATSNPGNFAPSRTIYGTTGGSDVFISKYNNDLDTHIKTIIIGSSQDDEALGVIVTGDNKYIYVSGTTKNPANFGAGRTILGATGDEDAFVTKISIDLDSIFNIVVISSNDKDEGQEVAIGHDGSVFLVGQAGNSNNFACSGCGQKVEFGDSDGDVEAFVSKFSNDLSTHIRTTLLTSDAEDEAYAIDFDQNNNVFIAGRTKNYDDFPCHKEYYGGQPSLKVGYSAFVTKLDYNLNCIKTGILASDVVSDVIRDIEIDNQGNVFVGGLTESSTTFPKSPKYTYGNNGGVTDADAFVVKLNNSLNNHSATAILASNDKDKVFSLYLDAAGNVNVAGYTLNPFGYTINDTLYGVIGSEDAVITTLSNSLSSLIRTNIVASSGVDICYGIYADQFDNLIAVGETGNSGNFAANRINFGNTGGSDAFILKFSNCTGVSSPMLSGNTNICAGNSTTITSTSAQSYLWNTGETSQSISVSQSGSYFNEATKNSGCHVHSDTIEVIVHDNPVGDLQPSISSGPTASDGSIGLTVSGGNPPYSYQWSNTDTTEDIFNLPGGSYSVTVTDNNGCTVSGSTIVEVATKVEKINEIAELGIYPNPTNGILFYDMELNASRSITIGLYDIAGQQIFNIEEYGDQMVGHMNLSNVPNGIYLLKISSGNEYMIRRVTLIR